MGPLTRGQCRGFQPWGEVPTEHEESQHGADRGTGEFAPATVFGRRFMPDKVSDVVRLQGVPKPARSTDRRRHIANTDRGLRSTGSSRN